MEYEEISFYELILEPKVPGQINMKNVGSYMRVLLYYFIILRQVLLP